MWSVLAWQEAVSRTSCQECDRQSWQETLGRNARRNRSRTSRPETRTDVGRVEIQDRGVSRGHTVSDESRAKNAAALRGRTRSPEHCANIAAAKRGKKQSPEVVAKRVNANRGQKRSEEVRAKMSAAQREAWQRRKKARGKLVQGWLFDALVVRFTNNVADSTDFWFIRGKRTGLEKSGHACPI